MSHPRFLPILLTAAMIAQSMIAGWGHSHVHIAADGHAHPGTAGHAAHDHLAGSHSHVHFHDSPERQPRPDCPTNEDDCSVCRHLALAAILALDLEAVAAGNIAELVQHGTSCPVSKLAIGLRRPRSPPELI